MRRLSTTTLAIATLAISTLACARGGDTTADTEDAGPVPQLAGEWVKADDLLPPVSLWLTQRGASVTARLRLSGVEAAGSGVVTAAGVSITIPGRAETLTGALEPGPRLRVRPSGVMADEVLLVRRSD